MEREYLKPTPPYEKTVFTIKNIVIGISIGLFLGICIALLIN